TTNEWIGRTDDEAIPPRVKVRIFQAFDGRCSHCTLLIVGKLRPAYDHTIALINGGENRESNVSLLCMPCHALKTKASGDAAVFSERDETTRGFFDELPSPAERRRDRRRPWRAHRSA